MASRRASRADGARERLPDLRAVAPAPRWCSPRTSSSWSPARPKTSASRCDDEVLAPLERALGVPEGGLYRVARAATRRPRGERTCRVPARRGRILGAWSGSGSTSTSSARTRTWSPASSRRPRTPGASRSSGSSSSAPPRSRCSRSAATTSARTGRRPYRRALAAGVEIHLPRFQPRSTLPMAACLWANDEGRVREFKHALYEAFF